jgi:hypothetical protein
LLESNLRGFSRNSERLVGEIQDKVSGKNTLLVAQIDGKRPGEIRGIRQAFIHERILGEDRAKSYGSWGCAVCNKEAFVRPALYVDFFTVEKRGFAPMGSDAEIWKYAPLCIDCAKWLCIAGTILNSHLRAQVAGKSAYLVPDLEPGVVGMPTRFVEYLWEFHERTSGRVVPEVKDFPEAEQEEASNLLEGLVEEYDWDGPPPFKSASLIFYEPGQKFKFLYITSDILPRQLKKASENLKSLRDLLRDGILGDLDLGEKIAHRLKGDFDFIRQAWSWPVKDRVKSAPLALDSMHLVEAILTQSPPAPQIFWSDVDKILRRLYLDIIGGKAKQTVEQAISYRAALIWVIWALVYEDKKGGVKMDTTVPFQSSRLPQGFWEEFFAGKRMLDANVKRGLFLVGVLLGRVEYRQRKEREDWKGEMPILSSIRGLTISVDEIKKRLFPQLMVKLRQLSEPLPEVEAAASYYLTQAEGITDEEARFVLCLGWALSQHTIDSIWKALSTTEKEGRQE